MSKLREYFLSLTTRSYSEKPLVIRGVGSVLAQTMTEAERGEVETAAGCPGDVKRLCVIHGIVDAATKEPVFKREDFEALGATMSPMINFLCDEVLALNKFSQEDIRKLLGEPGVG